MIPITHADRERFHRNAPAALTRRQAIATQLGQSFELILMGGTPIVGMVFFEWSASELLLFLLVGTWVKIFCDLLKVISIRAEVEKLAQEAYDDWHVWVMVDALREGRKTVPRSHIEAKFAPWPGVLIDFMFGGVATGMIAALMAKPESGFGNSTPDWWSGMMLSLITLNSYQILLTLWEILRHRWGAESGGGVAASPGVRGIGLFLLMFIVVIVTESGSESGAWAWGVMLVVNGLFVAFGLFGMGALVAFRGETQWLENYLQTTGTKSNQPQRAAKHLPNRDDQNRLAT